jgi:hypothetical protein
MAALGAVARVFLVSRIAVLVTAMLALLTFQLAGEARLDRPDLTHPFQGTRLGGFAELLFSSLARWDATWYLSIAHDGYSAPGAALTGQSNLNFFPLYPQVVRLVAGFSGSPELLLIASYVVSLAAFLGALYLLYRLVELELGPRIARTAVVLIALFPGSVFFSAPYSESLFLLLSVGAFYAARIDRWAWAGLLAAGASATRPPGFLVAVPVILLYFYGPRKTAARRRQGGRLRPRYPLRPNILWLGLAPAGLVLWGIYSAVRYGDPLAYQKVGKFWGREFANPLLGAWHGLEEAFQGLRRLASDTAAGASAGRNVELFGFLVFGLVTLVGALRRLPLAYGAYALVAVAAPLSTAAANGSPLQSLPRYLAVVFPLFIFLALVCEERRWTPTVAVIFAVLLGLSTAQFATWHQFI